MEKLSEKIVMLRESAVAVLDPTLPQKEKITEIGNSMIEISEIFAALLQRLRNLAE